MAQIAVVDDSRLARVFVEAALRKAGHAVLLIEPTSLTETLEVLVQWMPDLLILDHSMPAYQGPSLVRACFEHPALAKVKVIMLTALRDEAMQERMRKLGVDCVLHKPILHEELTEAVAQTLAAPPREE